jgi:hypothetical protein
MKNTQRLCFLNNLEYRLTFNYSIFDAIGKIE